MLTSSRPSIVFVTCQSKINREIYIIVFDYQTLNLGCTDMDTSTSSGTIWRHRQFLKNYNMIQQIGHRYDTSTISQMKCLCILALNKRIFCNPKTQYYSQIIKHCTIKQRVFLFHLFCEKEGIGQKQLSK